MRTLWLLAALALSSPAHGQGAASPFARDTGPRSELDGSVTLQLRAFPQRGALGQERVHPSLAVEFEYFREWPEAGSSLTLAPFLRFDQRDDRRTRGDLREAFFSHVGSGFELHLGLRRVFWGQTESKHLVDVINQVDLIENVDEEDRLGQPMLNVILLRDWGVLEAYLLPGFRERTFASTDGRLTGPFAIESARSGIRSVVDGRIDYALRWSHLLGNLELGLAWFDGSNREPEFELAGPVVPGEPIALRPRYRAMTQVSLDAQYIRGDWAWKLEALRRGGDSPRHHAFVAGVERTFVGIFGTRADLGVLAEYLYDDRGRQTPLLSFANDVFAGVRIAFNDLADSDLLAGVIVDHRSGRQVYSLEAGTRLGRHWRLAIEARAFRGESALRVGVLEDLLEPGRQWGAIVRDDYLQFELTRFF